MKRTLQASPGNHFSGLISLPTTFFSQFFLLFKAPANIRGTEFTPARNKTAKPFKVGSEGGTTNRGGSLAVIGLGRRAVAGLNERGTLDTNSNGDITEIFPFEGVKYEQLTVVLLNATKEQQASGETL